VFSLDKHLGDYKLSEILFGKVFTIKLGRWEKALSEEL
jgi:hypothetical protein